MSGMGSGAIRALARLNESVEAARAALTQLRAESVGAQLDGVEHPGMVSLVTALDDHYEPLDAALTNWVRGGVE